MPPITRIERDSQKKRCARLRRAVLHSLRQAIEPHARSATAIRALIQESDIDKYFDIYDIDQDDIDEMNLGIKEGEFDDMESLRALKAYIHRLHTTRRVFLCCLLALDAHGGYSDFAAWRMVVEELKILGITMSETGRTLHRASEEQERINVPSTPRTVPSSPTSEKWRGQMRKLNSLSQALRGLQAKMQLLREESDRTIHESLDLAEIGPDILAHYDSIGSDLQALVTEWENGRAMLLQSIDKQQDAVSARNSLLFASSTTMGGEPSDLAGETPRNSWGTTVMGAEELAKLKEETTTPPAASEEKKEDDDGQMEVVFEGVSEPKAKPRSTLTREERIRRVQEERVRLAEERKRAEAGRDFVKELQTVLVNRPPVVQRRIPVRASMD